MIASDFDAMQAELQALQNKSAEVRQAKPEIAPLVAAELHATHEAVADLGLGVERQPETSYATPPTDFAENPLIVGQQVSTRERVFDATR